MLISPTELARFIPIRVPTKVQPSACTDLQEAQRQTGPMCDLEESSEKSGASAYLIGLASARNQLADLHPVLAQGLAKRGPCMRGVSVSSNRRIVRSELRQALLQHEAINSAHQP